MKMEMMMPPLRTIKMRIVRRRGGSSLQHSLKSSEAFLQRTAPYFYSYTTLLLLFAPMLYSLLSSYFHSSPCGPFDQLTAFYDWHDDQQDDDINDDDDINAQNDDRT